ncbi:MAG: Franean1_4349 family RiPP, partial [Anaerolineae bacterium]
MSKEAVEKIVGRAVLDSQFREALFADPDEVLGEYELTQEEVAALKAIDFETMESFAGTLDDRISKVGLIG